MLDWVNLYAMAVNEENAAGGRVVTAPTNGAAGSSPQCCITTCGSCPVRTMRALPPLLTAGAIGIIYKGQRIAFGCRGGLPGRGGVAAPWPQVRWRR